MFLRDVAFNTMQKAVTVMETLQITKCNKPSDIMTQHIVFSNLLVKSTYPLIPTFGPIVTTGIQYKYRQLQTHTNTHSLFIMLKLFYRHVNNLFWKSNLAKNNPKMNSTLRPNGGLVWDNFANSGISYSNL